MLPNQPESKELFIFLPPTRTGPSYRIDSASGNLSKDGVLLEVSDEVRAALIALCDANSCGWRSVHSNPPSIHWNAAGLGG